MKPIQVLGFYEDVLRNKNKKRSRTSTLLAVCFLAIRCHLIILAGPLKQDRPPVLINSTAQKKHTLWKYFMGAWRSILNTYRTQVMGGRGTSLGFVRIFFTSGVHSCSFAYFPHLFFFFVVVVC